MFLVEKLCVEQLTDFIESIGRMESVDVPHCAVNFEKDVFQLVRERTQATRPVALELKAELCRRRLFKCRSAVNVTGSKTLPERGGDVAAVIDSDSCRN